VNPGTSSLYLLKPTNIAKQIMEPLCPICYAGLPILMKEYREGTRHKASMIEAAKKLCALAQPTVVCDGVIDLNKV
jgi:hypothetical protein